MEYRKVVINLKDYDEEPSLQCAGKAAAASGNFQKVVPTLSKP
jgi:hypothetical protein